ncbi:hypothetical protein GC177_10290 [bacterium]|nr:hypothetical protein [bacterium]
MSTTMFTHETGVWKVSDAGKELLEEVFDRELGAYYPMEAAMTAIQEFFAACGAHGKVGYKGSEEPTFRQIIEELGNAFISTSNPHAFNQAYTEWCYDRILDFNIAMSEQAELAREAINEFSRRLVDSAPHLLDAHLIASVHELRNMMILATTHDSADVIRNKWEDEAPNSLFATPDEVEALIASKDEQLGRLADLFKQARDNGIV